MHGEFQLTISADGGAQSEWGYTFKLKAERADDDIELAFVFPYVDTSGDSDARAVIIKSSQVQLGVCSISAVEHPLCAWCMTHRRAIRASENSTLRHPVWLPCGQACRRLPSCPLAFAPRGCLMIAKAVDPNAGWCARLTTCVFGCCLLAPCAEDETERLTMHLAQRAESHERLQKELEAEKNKRRQAERNNEPLSAPSSISRIYLQLPGLDEALTLEKVGNFDSPRLNILNTDEEAKSKFIGSR